MNIAIQGCLHGELDLLYSKLQELQTKLKIKIDLLLVCGDFQAIRDKNYLDYMHCPPKYKTLGDFHKYYSQTKTAPILTIFIGGNHEAVNYLRDVYFGGWVAKNIYYLGQAGSIYVKKGDTSIRITGMSGIYDHKDFKYKLQTQQIPLHGSSQITAYHIKQIQVYRLELLSRIQSVKKNESKENNGSQFDIFLSHDWPRNICLYGDLKQLYKYKEYLKEQIQKGILGSPPGQRLMSRSIGLQPICTVNLHVCIPMKISLLQVFCPQINVQIKGHAFRFQDFRKNVKKQNLKQHLKSNKSQVTIQYDQTWLIVLQMTKYMQNCGKALYKCFSFDLSCKNGLTCQSVSKVQKEPKITVNFSTIRGSITSNIDTTQKLINLKKYL